MKNTMKKIMSLLLVAVLLVSAIPFQAFADGGTWTLVADGESFPMTDSDGQLTWNEVCEEVGYTGTTNWPEFEALESRFPITLTGATVVVNIDDYTVTSTVTSTIDDYTVTSTNDVREPETPETPAQIQIVVNFYGKDTKDNNDLVANYTETCDKGVTVQHLWNELHPNELSGQAWTAKIGSNSYPGTEPIYGSCTLNFYTDKVTSVAGVELIQPGQDYAATFTLISVVNGTRIWTSTEDADGVTYGQLKAQHQGGDEGYEYSMTSRIYKTIYDNMPVAAEDVVTMYCVTDYYDDSSSNSNSNNTNNNNSNSNNSSSNNNSSNNSSSSDDNSSNNNSSNTNGSYVIGDTYYGSNYGTEVNKYPYDVILNVYLNNQIGTINKKIVLNTGIALDGKVTYTEVKNLLKNYYTANDSDGLQLDGLYLQLGNWVGHFAYDMAKYATLENLDEERKAHEVNIIVMLTNATAKTSTVASSDNPKTGDAIYACVTIMGVSATALAVLYFYNKKRAF